MTIQFDNNRQLTIYHLYADISMQIYPKGKRNYKFSINHFTYANKSKNLRNSAECAVTKLQAGRPRKRGFISLMDKRFISCPVRQDRLWEPIQHQI
jgi:hypothetical protein